MIRSIPEVQASRPDHLTQAAARVGSSASALADQISTQRRNLDQLRDGWRGMAADAAIAKAQPTLERMQTAHNALQNLRAALQAGGDQLTQSRHTVLQTVDQLKRQGWQVAPDGTVSAKPGGPLDRFAGISRVNEVKVMQLAAADSLAVKTQLAHFTTADGATGQNIRNAIAGLGDQPFKTGPGGPLPDGPPGQDEPKIPDDKDPKKIKQWWDSLTPEQRAQLSREHPDIIGNLNGVPVVDRSAVNKAVVQQDIGRVDSAAAAHCVTLDEIKAHPEKYGLTATDITRYSNAVNVNNAMARDSRDAKDANNRSPDVYLVKYEPEAFGGKGAAAIAMGNPDTAPNTAVTVSGFTTSVAHGSLDSPDGVNLYHEANMADKSHPTAVVQWMGYDAPNDQAVAEPNMARNGARLLATDVNALAVTHQGPPTHLTVIGHSYGSTTVSDAAAGFGMHADDVVLIGSPGTDLARSAADFHLPPNGHLYVGAASTDPVTHLGTEHGSVIGTGLGTDPAMDGFGSTRFRAESAQWDWNPLADHSYYFQRGSESLFGIADIASGHGDALEHDGMTAGHRTDMSAIPFLPGIPGVHITNPWADQFSDPESWRVANNDHYHR